MTTLRSLLALTAFGCMLAGVAHATDIEVVDTNEAPGGVASVPVILDNTNGEVSLVALTITVQNGLPAPTVQAAEQTNLDPNGSPVNLFVDELAPNTYRITAFALDAPNLAVGTGNAFNILFDLDGVNEDAYGITITSAEVYDINSNEVSNALQSGLLTVAEPTNVGDWTILQN